MLLGCPWLREAKVSHDWVNNIIILQGTNLIRIILVTKKLRGPTKSLEKLVCYDFHFGIFDEENLMFVIRSKLFSIGNIIVVKPTKLDQTIIFIPSTNIGLVE